MTSSRQRGKAIRHNWTLTQILDEAAIEEETNAQASEIDQHLERDNGQSQDQVH